MKILIALLLALSVHAEGDILLIGVAGQPIREEYREVNGKAYAIHPRVAWERKFATDVGGHETGFPLKDWVRVRGEIVRVFPEGVLVKRMFGDGSMFVRNLPGRIVSGATVDLIAMTTKEDFKFKAHFGNAEHSLPVRDFGKWITKERAEELWAAAKSAQK